MKKKKFAIKSLTRFLDAAVVGGFVLLNEANSVKGDPGKKRSKLHWLHVLKQVTVIKILND